VRSASLPPFPLSKRGNGKGRDHSQINSKAIDDSKETKRETSRGEVWKEGCRSQKREEARELGNEGTDRPGSARRVSADSKPKVSRRELNSDPRESEGFRDESAFLLSQSPWPRVGPRPPVLAEVSLVILLPSDRHLESANFCARALRSSTCRRLPSQRSASLRTQR
jgi:hypothetical protein